MKKIFKAIVFLSIGAMVFSSCKKNKKDDPTPENPENPEAGDQENITRVELHLRDSSNAGSVYVVKFNDPDGESGSRTPIVDSLKLLANKTYLVEVKIYDDTKTPVDTVTDEIREEQNYHYFHYTYTSNSGTATVQSTITDKDTHTPPMEVGLEFKLKTGTGTGKGTFNVSLRHFANDVPKTADPKGGEQDILVDFPTLISL